MESAVPPEPVGSVSPSEHQRHGPESSPTTAMGGRVLVLNATFEPINVCTVRRAVVLLLKEKAELLERGRWELHSESSTLARPVVIRLVTYVKVPRDAHRRKITRRAVFARDSWTCQYCGSRSNLTVDHVIPRSKGGSSSWENIVASCAPCNRRKGDRLPRQAGMHPRHAPAHAAGGDLHPRRQPDDPGGLAAVSAAGGLSRHTAGRGRSTTKGAPTDGALRVTALTGIDRERLNCSRRDQSRRPSRGVPGWIPLSGPASRPSGRSPPGSRKYCHSTFGPPPFSGPRRVANGDDIGRRKMPNADKNEKNGDAIGLCVPHRAGRRTDGCSSVDDDPELLGVARSGTAPAAERLGTDGDDPDPRFGVLRFEDVGEVPGRGDPGRDDRLGAWRGS